LTSIITVYYLEGNNGVRILQQSMQPRSSIFLRDIIGIIFIHMEFQILQQACVCKRTTSHYRRVLTRCHLTAYRPSHSLPTVLDLIVNQVLFYLVKVCVRRLTEQPLLTSIIQKRRLMLFGDLIRMDESADAGRILTAVPQSDWRRPVGGPYSSWMVTLNNDLSLHNLTYEDAIEMALDRPLWRLLAASGATH